jgi:hypothetical protein
MEAYKITLEQKELIEGQQFDIDRYFNPVQDINGDWFISPVEVNECINKDFTWVSELILTNYIPINYE